MLQVARDGANAPFADELRALAGAHPALATLTVFTRARAEDRRGVDHDAAGRPDAALVAAWLPPEADRHVRLCGPPGFVERVTALAIAAGTPAERIVAESF